MDVCVVTRDVINKKHSSYISKGQIANSINFQQIPCLSSVIHGKEDHDVDCQYQSDHYRDLKAEISFLISLTSSSVTPSFSAFRCS